MKGRFLLVYWQIWWSGHGPLGQQKGEFSGPLADSGLVMDHWMGDFSGPLADLEVWSRTTGPEKGRVLLVHWQIQWSGYGPLDQWKGELSGPLADIVVWSRTTAPVEGRVSLLVHWHSNI